MRRRIIIGGAKIYIDVYSIARSAVTLGGVLMAATSLVHIHEHPEHQRHNKLMPVRRDNFISAPAYNP